MTFIKWTLFLILCVLCWPVAVLVACLWVPYKLLVMTGKVTAWGVRTTVNGAAAVSNSAQATPQQPVQRWEGEHGPEIIKLPRGARIYRKDVP